MRSIFSPVDIRAKLAPIQPLSLSVTSIRRRGKRLLWVGALAELPEQIEHFGRNIFFHRLLIGRAEGMADLRTRSPLLLRFRDLVHVRLGNGVGLAPAVPVVFEAQSQTPRGSAAPAAFVRNALPPGTRGSRVRRVVPRANKGPQSHVKQKSRMLVP